jgi:DNA-binding winged helix-turn-helix (wHTH) protein/TolB-like protein/Tfp pilus assembly protein PilF
MLRVGHGQFDPLRGELSLDGRTVKLRPRTAALLSHMVRNERRTVSKDELMQAVWPDVVVTDDSLVQCVVEIRQALGPAGHDWIRTLPRQGYAFVGTPLDLPPTQPEGPLPAVTAGPSPAATPALEVEFRAQSQPMPGGAAWRLDVAQVRAVGAFFIVAAVAAGAWALREWRDTAPIAAPPLSLIVMPVANQTGAKAHENAVDDLTESLTDALARTAGTTVIAPSTALAFKGAPVDVRRIGADLNVRYVLQGSLKLDGSRPVLTMRLVDASTSVQLWNQEFRPEAMPALRDLVVGRVADTLGLQLLRADSRRAERLAPPRPLAESLMSEARAVMRVAGETSAGALQARRLIEDSVREDESDAQAWATLASTYLTNVRLAATREADLARAGEAVQRALALAPDNDMVRLAEGRVYYEQGRMPQALIAFERAIELNPNNAQAVAFRGAALLMLGRPRETLPLIERAMRISPLDRFVPLWQLLAGVAHLHLHNDAAAVEALMRSVAEWPSFTLGQLFLASALAASGRIPEARAAVAQVRRLAPDLTISRFRSLEPSDAPAFLRQRERVYQGLRSAGMPE